MARNNNKSFYQLIALIITLIVFAVKFLCEVNRLKLWNEFFLSTIVFLLVNSASYGIGLLVTSDDVILWSLLITSVIYCLYWHSKFSYKNTRLNASMWKERQWWWTLDGWQFEQEVANVFRINGYKATVTKGSGDGGVDIILKKDNYTAIVQCKHYQNPVPPEPIRALWGCKDDFNADEVILVASSGITDMGAKFVQNKPNFKVLNLDDIIKMSKQVENEIPKVKSIETKSIEKNIVKSTNGRKLDL